MIDTLRHLFEVGQHPLTPIGADGPLLHFRTKTGQPVRGVLCRPDIAGRMPVVLVIHAHGDRYDIGCAELMDGRPALQSPLGPALAAMGIASVCIDMPCFGSRADETESAAAKRLLWQGRSLAGQMVGECAAALDWLTEQDWVDSARIGVFGISMGATLGYWLAAVDGRVAVLAQECCLADFAALIDSGAHDLHGIYLTIPGLLTVASNGQIAGLVAPRAQFIGIGDTDPLTPPMAADIALDQVRAAYGAAGGRLVIHREPHSGHVETPAMRTGVLAFFAETLA